MVRLRGVARSGRGRLAIATGLVVAIVAGFAAPGFACDAIVKGTTNCSTGDQVITWTISSDRTDLEMDITHALASVNTTPTPTFYPTTGWSPTVAPGGSTTATTVVPAGVTGTITLNVYVFWPAILATQSPKIDGQMLILNQCAAPTTTSAAPTTTSPASSTTTGPTSTTTTTHPNTSTTYLQSTSTTSSSSTTSTSTSSTSTSSTSTSTSTSTSSTTSSTSSTTTSTTYPHNTSTTYAQSTSTTHPHNTTTTCAPTKNNTLTHKSSHKKKPHKPVTPPVKHKSTSVWWPAAWFA